MFFFRKGTKKEGAEPDIKAKYSSLYCSLGSWSTVCVWNNLSLSPTPSAIPSRRAEGGGGEIEYERPSD